MSEEKKLKKYITFLNEDVDGSGFVLFPEELLKELETKGWKGDDTLKLEVLTLKDGIIITNITKPFRDADEARKEAISIDME